GVGRELEAPAAETEKLLRERVSDAAPELIDWLPLAGVVLGLDLPDTDATRHLDEKFVQVRLHETIVRLLGALVPGPALFVLEDLDWIDEASHELLLAIAAPAAEHPSLVVVTRSSEVASRASPPP